MQRDQIAVRYSAPSGNIGVARNLSWGNSAGFVNFFPGGGSIWGDKGADGSGLWEGVNSVKTLIRKIDKTGSVADETQLEMNGMT